MEQSYKFILVGILSSLLIFLWIKEFICLKFNTDNWQQYITCKLGLHWFTKKKISIIRIKQCKYCNHIIEGYK